MGKVIKAGKGQAKDLGIEVKPMGFSLQPLETTDPEAVAAKSSPEETEAAQAETVLEKAQREADIIIRSAKAEADTVLDQARREGYQAGLDEGLRDGFEQAAKQADALIAKLDEHLAEIPAERAAIIDQIEPQVLNLCLEIVEKIIRHEVKTDSRVVVRMIKSCLRRIKDCDEVYLRVNPKEVELLREMRDELLAVTEGVRTINITDDRRVSPGGCIIETPSGDFDARLETQMTKVENTIREIFDSEKSCDGQHGGPAGPDEISKSDQ